MTFKEYVEMLKSKKTGKIRYYYTLCSKLDEIYEGKHTDEELIEYAFRDKLIEEDVYREVRRRLEMDKKILKEQEES